MKEKTGMVESLRELGSSLRLSNLKNNAEEIVLSGEAETATPVGFLKDVLEKELDGRQTRTARRRIKEACFPFTKTFEDFDTGRLENFSEDKLKRLRELSWIEERYNLFFVGLPGTGKTHLACALAYQAAEEGYAVHFISMTELLRLLSEVPVVERDRKRLIRIRSSSLLVIDGVGDFPVSSFEATLFFHLLSELHEKCSILITGNNGPETWPEIFENDSQLLAALDRLMFKCEVVRMVAPSFRVEHRTTLFGE